MIIWVIRLVLLQNAVSTGKQEKTAGGRILLGGRNNKFITRYGGGPNSIGGVVNFVTGPVYENSLTVGYGSNNTKKFNAKTNTIINWKFCNCV